MPKMSATPDGFWNDLDPARSEVVRRLQSILVEVEPELEQRFKWNAPSYAWHGDDRVTFNLAAKDTVRLVFHAGTARKEDRNGPPLFVDDSGLLTWQSDIRALASFRSLEDVERHQVALREVVRRWLDALA